MESSRTKLFEYFQERTKRYNLKGHNSQVRNVFLLLDNSSLTACDKNGAIYSWAVETGQRIGEYIRKVGGVQTNRRFVALLDDNRLWVLDNGAKMPF